MRHACSWGWRKETMPSGPEEEQQQRRPRGRLAGQWRRRVWALTSTRVGQQDLRKISLWLRAHRAPTRSTRCEWCLSSGPSIRPLTLRSSRKKGESNGACSPHTGLCQRLPADHALSEAAATWGMPKGNMIEHISGVRWWRMAWRFYLKDSTRHESHGGRELQGIICLGRWQPLERVELIIGASISLPPSLV